MLDILIEKYNKVTLSRAEVARELSISKSHLSDLISENLLPIPHKRIGNSQKAKYIFKITDVANYLEYVDTRLAA